MNVDLLLVRIGKAFQTIKSLKLLKTLIRHHVLCCAEQRGVLSFDLATIVDIGANRGQFALAARHWASNARVISFEPQMPAATRFQRIFSNDPNVTFHRAAIGPKSGNATIHVSAADDASSLLPISEKQQHLFPGTHEIRTEQVEIGSLSTYVDSSEIIPPAMLKLDVQGYELETLRGCEELLYRFAYIYAECSFIELYEGQALAKDIIVWLHDRKWHFVGVYNTLHDRQGNSVQADFLFRNFAKAEIQ
jgi:FkbM family methyltransferase